LSSCTQKAQPLITFEVDRKISVSTGASELPNYLDAGHFRPRAKLYPPVIA